MSTSILSSTFDDAAGSTAERKVRRFASARDLSERPPELDGPEPEIALPAQPDASPAREAMPVEADTPVSPQAADVRNEDGAGAEASAPGEPLTLAEAVDLDKIPPSGRVRPETAHDIFLRPTYLNNEPRVFMDEFRSRLRLFRNDILNGVLPLEALLYDFPEELARKTPEEITAFFDRMMTSTGIGVDQPTDNPLGVHPFLWRLFQRLEDPAEALRRMEMLREDRATMLRSLEASGNALNAAEASGQAFGTDAALRRSPFGGGPVEMFLRQGPQAGVAEQPSNGDSAAPRPDGAPSDTQTDTPSDDVPRGGATRRGGAEAAPTAAGDGTAEMGWRPVRGADPMQSFQPGGMNAIPGGGMVRPPGLASAMWYGLGNMFDAAATRVSDGITNMGRKSPGAVPPAARVVSSDLDTSIESIERDCDRLAELSAWAQYVAKKPFMSSVLSRIEELAKARDVDAETMWKHIHDVGRNQRQDRALDAIVKDLRRAIQDENLDAPLKEFRDLASSLEKRIGAKGEELANAGEEAAEETKRLSGALEKVKKADLPFEKPGEESGLEELKRTAERIAKFVKNLLDKMFGRKAGAAEPVPESSPAPSM